ncbi:hypothetical protein Dimus_002557, partial [Dionaea muscipula]
ITSLKKKSSQMATPPIILLSILVLLLLLLHFSSIFTLTLPSDVAALQSFKAAIKPSSIPSGSCVGSWNFTSDPCSLPRRTHFLCGISCSPDATRVTSLTLDSVGYSGTLSPLLSRLTRLMILDLSDNSFHGSIPLSIFSSGSLSGLHTLYLSRNSLSGPLPSAVANLKSLQQLDLSGNLLSGSLPDSLFSLSCLNTLDLSFNNFTGSLPRLPPNLSELTIKGNSLSGSLQKSSFEGLARLVVVDLSANSFAGVLQGWFFKQLRSLQQVNLSNNSLTGVEVWKPDGGYTGVVAVDLGFNQIEGRVPVNFSDYPMLWSLTLRYNRLRGPIPWQFGKKGTTLKRLYLDGNYLTGRPPPGLISGDPSVPAGSLGNNCLEGCPASSQLCLPSQKPLSVCKLAYSGRRKPRL